MFYKPILEYRPYTFKSSIPGPGPTPHPLTEPLDTSPAELVVHNPDLRHLILKSIEEQMSRDDTQAFRSRFYSLMLTSKVFFLDAASILWREVENAAFLPNILKTTIESLDGFIWGPDRLL